MTDALTPAQVYDRAWRARNRERIRQRRKLTNAAANANRRAERGGTPGRITAADVADVLRAGCCVYCGATTELGIDHVVPLSRGGANHVDNLVASCTPCNCSKFQGPSPRRWAQDHDACIDCGTTHFRHNSHGRCTSCEARHRKGVA